MESSISIENHSVGLKNSSNSERGKWAEDVVSEFLLQKKWIIISRRKKYQFGEIDIIVQRYQQIALIEVKYLHAHWMSFERISKKQINRLEKNLNYLSKTEFIKNDVKLFLCFVQNNKKIEWVDLTGD